MTTVLDPQRRRLWPIVRRVWITAGLAVTAIFVLWSVLAYRATGDARAALQTDGRVAVTLADGYWAFDPGTPSSTGLLFFAGALVDPAAYAPLARTIADDGFTVMLVALPRRGVLGGADGPEVFARARAAAAARPRVTRWVAAGHSRGGVVVAELVRDGFPGLAGAVLIGTSHPRDFSIAAASIPITRIYGTRDTIADVEKLARTRANLPASTRIVAIEGGNHSQFGYYGFQPGDWPATIPREAQQAITERALLEALRAAATR
ncbi:MAG TPA: alpha/beta hydrolase [Vicinamibacterales bacterium]|nr:alpha/beta hydrolase [Vicinamibacterales bacterium]